MHAVDYSQLLIFLIRVIFAKALVYNDKLNSVYMNELIHYKVILFVNFMLCILILYYFIFT